MPRYDLREEAALYPRCVTMISGWKMQPLTSPHLISGRGTCGVCSIAACHIYLHFLGMIVRYRPYPPASVWEGPCRAL